MTHKQFMDENFLLGNRFAERLYHEYAADMPVIDYHNHLDPALIATDHRFRSITDAWLSGDHYKWRAMRTLGIDESYITGGQPDLDRFEKWAYTVPYTLRNPLYHWTHLELQRYFGIRDLLGSESAASVYHRCNELLQEPGYSVLGLLTRQQVKVVCTTDDPADDLSWHRQHRASGHEVSMFPSFRPDKYIAIESEGFLQQLCRLQTVSGSEIRTYGELILTLRERAAYFASLGCRASDHGLDRIADADYTYPEIEAIFLSRLNGGTLSSTDIEKFRTAILYDLGLIYHELGWVQQYHLGALRSNNSRALHSLGPDTGWDSIGDQPQARPLSRLLDRLDKENKLTRTIIYNLNPAWNEVFATMAGNFNDGSVKGKMQFGAAWWFLDQKDGMEKQLNALSNMGLLSCFVGMLTDSRSFLSFPRHEYFRRILCNLLGAEIASGLLPDDLPWIGKIVQDICYHNIREYLNVPAHV